MLAMCLLHTSHNHMEATVLRSSIVGQPQASCPWHTCPHLFKHHPDRLSSPSKKFVGPAFQPVDLPWRLRKDLLESRSHSEIEFLNGLLEYSRRFCVALPPSLSRFLGTTAVDILLQSSVR